MEIIEFRSEAEWLYFEQTGQRMQMPAPLLKRLTQWVRALLSRPERTKDSATVTEIEASPIAA